MADPRFFTRNATLNLRDVVAATKVKAVMNDGADADVTGAFDDIAPLDQAGAQHVSFFDNVRYLDAFTRSHAGACFVREKFVSKAPDGMVLLVTPEPYYCYAQLATQLYPEATPDAVISAAAHVDARAVIGNNVRIDAGAVIESDVTIGTGTHIGANCVISRGVTIGNHCRIGALCTISHADLGDHVIMHPSAHVGQAGFGFAPSPQGVINVPQLGRVIIEDHVDIGSSTCIDRGSGPDTRIGAHTKIDNLVQIAHNVQIGKYCFIAAHAGLAGSSSVGDFVMVGGQVGLAGHTHIGDGAKIIAQSGVIHNLAPGATYGGSPALPAREWHRQTATISKLSKKSAAKT